MCRSTQRRKLAAQEIADQRDHHVRLVFEREVPGVDEMQLGVRQVAQIGVAPSAGKI